MAKPVRSHFVKDDDIREWVILFRDRQEPVRAIAEKFGVHQNTIWYHFGKLGIYRRSTEKERLKELKKFVKGK